MTKLVLADTGPLYALADRSDQYHRRATNELGRLHSQDRGIAVLTVTICEAHTLVLRRLGGTYSRQWLSQLLDGSVQVVPELPDVFAAVAQIERFPDHPVTLVDGLTAVVSRRLSVPVWSFDRHFVTMQTDLWARE